MKTWFLVSNIGFAICICGEILRKLAMLTAQSNFNHLVRNCLANFVLYTTLMN